jgi:hypothetical protein
MKIPLEEVEFIREWWWTEQEILDLDSPPNVVEIFKGDSSFMGDFSISDPRTEEKIWVTNFDYIFVISIITT